MHKIFENPLSYDPDILQTGFDLGVDKVINFYANCHPV